MRNKLKRVTNKGSSLVTKAASSLKRLGNEAYKTKTGQKIGNKVYSTYVGKKGVNWLTKKNKEQVKKNALKKLPTQTAKVNLPRTGKQIDVLKEQGNLGKKEQSVAAYVEGNVVPFAIAYNAQNRAEKIRRGEILYKNMTPMEREELKVQGEIKKQEQKEQNFYNETHSPFNSRSEFEESVYDEAQRRHTEKKAAAAKKNEANPFPSMKTGRLLESPSFRNEFYKVKRENAERMRKATEAPSPRLAVTPRANRVKAMLKRENTPEPNLSPPPIPNWAANLNNNPRTPSPPIRSTFAPVPSAWKY